MVSKNHKDWLKSDRSSSNSSQRVLIKITEKKNNSFKAALHHSSKQRDITWTLDGKSWLVDTSTLQERTHTKERCWFMHHPTEEQNHKVPDYRHLRDCLIRKILALQGKKSVTFKHSVEMVIEWERWTSKKKNLISNKRHAQE